MDFTSRSELAAIQRAVKGPQRTTQELETLRLLQAMNFADAQRDATPPEVRHERCAAVLAGMVKPAGAEAVRARKWVDAKLPAKRVAVMCGGFPKERAEERLASFNAVERGRIWYEIEKLIGELKEIQKCMNGGTVPGAVQ